MGQPFIPWVHSEAETVPGSPPQPRCEANMRDRIEMAYTGWPDGSPLGVLVTVIVMMVALVMIARLLRDKK